MEAAWARKYRPKDFNDYIGESVKNTVLNRFSGEDLPNVVLISGNRGSGKTSLAWLLAKEYNCLDKQSGHACNKCAVCSDINFHIENAETGMAVYGVQEIDIAAEGRRANIDEILEEALLAPQYPLKYKILIMDEFHMASKNVQNRLLKIMEEPPKHLVFILCTTDAESILTTILSRCQLRLEVHRADKVGLYNRLLYISKQEGLKVTREALELIIEKRDRTPREAVMLLESVAKSNGNVVTVDNVYKQLNDIDGDLYIDFYNCADKELEDVLGFIYKLKDKDIDLLKFTSNLINFTLECVYTKYGYGLSENNSAFVKKMHKLFRLYSNTEIDGLLQILSNTINKMYNTKQVELYLIVLALRIGKIGLFRNTLADRAADAERENKKAVHDYAEGHRLETTDAQELITLEMALDDTGTNLKRVSETTKFNIDTEGSAGNDLPIDERELLSFFGETKN